MDWGAALVSAHGQNWGANVEGVAPEDADPADDEEEEDDDDEPAGSGPTSAAIATAKIPSSTTKMATIRPVWASD
jgi:hypothetical protein